MSQITLTPEGRNALKKAIAHWQRYADGLGSSEGYPGLDNCELCAVYYDEEDDDLDLAARVRETPNYEPVCCAGCPVRQRTGKPLCEDSPYGDVWDALHPRFFESEGRVDDPQYTSPEFITVARRMVDFLTRLLDDSQERT